MKLCSGKMPYVCISLSLLTLGSSGSPSLIFCTTTAWHTSTPVGSDALSSYTIRGGRLGSGINLEGGKKLRGGGGMEVDSALSAVQISLEKRRLAFVGILIVLLTVHLSHFTCPPNHFTPSALNPSVYHFPPNTNTYTHS